MKPRFSILVALCTIASLSTLFAQNKTVDGITAEEYSRRRQSLIQMLDTGSVFVIRAPEAEGEYEVMNYRQDLDFLYLTGVNSPGYTLLIVPRGFDFDGRTMTSLLFAPAYLLTGPDRFSGSVVPHHLFRGDADSVIGDGAFRKYFLSSMEGTKRLYYSAPGLTFVHDWLNDKPYFIEKEVNKSLKARNPGLKIGKTSGLVARLRVIKSPGEIELMRMSVNITGNGIDAAMKACKPGIWEYELRAGIEFEMMKQGAERTSFRSIVGAGRNSLSPHYMDNNCQALDGQVVVMDVGAEYHGYAADITRTIPVSGKFSKEQAEIYSAVLKVQEELIGMIQPGITMGSIDRKAAELIAAAGFKKYNIHGVTHPVGLDVHDVFADDTLRAGMVITIEPGIYIPEGDTLLPAAYRAVGVRIEDDVLVTANGYDLLSKEIPKTIADIERRMK